VRRSLVAAICLVLTGSLAPAARADLADASVKLTTLTTSLASPVAMAVRPGDAALYIAEKVGRVRPVDASTGAIGAAVLDISPTVSNGNEQGLLGLTFNAAGDKLYVFFTDETGTGPAGDDVLREYAFDGMSATSPRDLLRIPDPYANHNGGNVAFGPDGYLYVGTGDGGAAGDPGGRAQNIGSLFGKMLRLDPQPSATKPYTVPPSNPYVGRRGNDLIWARGLRNPWRWSFDRQTGDMWIGDVGQGHYEEIDVDPAGSPLADNYGWSRMEGRHRYLGRTPPRRHHPPIYEYAHANGNCAVTGGYVYRGSATPDLVGAYVFADFCVGNLRAFVRIPGQGATGHRQLGVKVDLASAFGEDAAGELYVMSLGGGLYRLDPT
jgi:glucose/arabinose dehydrogenase